MTVPCRTQNFICVLFFCFLDVENIINISQFLRNMLSKKKLVIDFYTRMMNKMYSIFGDMPFIKQYWPFILTGFLCYLSTRIFYSKYASQDKKKDIINSTYQTPDEIAEISENNSDDTQNDENEECDDDYQPSLPSDLEHIPLNYDRISIDETIDRSNEFYNFMNLRRTVRHFSQEDVPIEVIRNIIRTAGTAPSGAHTEPWTYVVVHNMEIKKQIREIIEAEEEINYKKRMGKQWTTDLKPLKTNWIKEYLTDAPYLILLFKQLFSFKNGVKRMHYYNEISVCLSAGLLMTAVHYAGLVSLTSTPLNCGPALRTLLNRPSNEKLVLLLPVGYPAEKCLVPDLQRKDLSEYTIEML
ncbi:iodotyrosine deiodinase 1 [Chrysoperla carnea]|uniref:iodotyrosine deiodinase 1 n=1 Tax=Chrysoperla carnea TaxID=189513 RepID=UPI001D06A8F5|nr:iodotyrosine deiodinase 1 [Chrysoperla carnea]